MPLDFLASGRVILIFVVFIRLMRTRKIIPAERVKLSCKDNSDKRAERKTIPSIGCRRVQRRGNGRW